MLEDELAQFADSFALAALGPDAIHQCKRIFIDTLGCALGGVQNPALELGLQPISQVRSKRPATVLWRDLTTSADLAAFANGVAIRYLDFNDTYTSKELGHPSDQIAPLLATAEVMHSPGGRLLEAIALAYEVFGRLADAVNIRERGFDYVTLLCISTVLAVGKLMGLSRIQLANAVRLAAVANGALFQTRIGDVSLWKACAAANASRNALFAAELAQAGMTGPPSIFEGRDGFFRAIAGGEFAVEMTACSGRELKVFAVDMKRYPIGHVSQTAVDAALAVREGITNPQDITSIEVRTFQAAISIMAGDSEKWRPRNRETADHSMPYAIAVAMLRGSLSVDSFDDEHLASPAVLSLLPKITVALSPESERDWPEAMLTTLRVRLASGSILEAASRYHRGHRNNPMTDGELAEKFSRLAVRRLPASEIESVLRRFWALDECADLHALVSSLGSSRNHVV